MVRLATLGILSIFLGACASERHFTKRDAVRVAEAEVIRRGYSIPQHWRRVVVDRWVDFELSRSYPVYLVRFQRDSSERSTVFKVVVNPTSHKAEDFTDMRMSVPLH